MTKSVLLEGPRPVRRVWDSRPIFVSSPLLEAKQRGYMKSQGCKQQTLVALLDADARVMRPYVDRRRFMVARVMIERGFCKT